MNRKVIIILISSFCFSKSNAQVFDSSSMMLSVKISLLEFATNLDSLNQAIDFLSSPLDYKILKSSGFSKDIIFSENIINA